MKTRLFILLLLLCILERTAGAQEGSSPEPAALRKADKLFKAQNWAEARTAYDAARDQRKDWHAPAVRRAVEGAVTCSVKLALWQDALDRAEEYIVHTRDSLDEVTGQRWSAALYLTTPHSGLTRNGRLIHEEAYGNGRYIAKEDRLEAVTRLERARDLVAALTARPDDAAPIPLDRARATQEWIGTDFDLSSALARETGDKIGAQDADWWAGTRPAPGDTAAGDGDDTEVDPSGDTAPRYDDDDHSEPPTGIPLRPDGGPLFPATPSAYATAPSAGEKVRFLLAEIERLDSSATRDDAARALLRRAMITFRVYGPDSADRWLNWWKQNRDHGLKPKPAAPPMPATKVWQLGDDQALTPVGGRLAVVDLPADESPLALLRALQTRYPQSALVPEARFAQGLYLQRRQQFPQALAAYRAFEQAYPKHPRSGTVGAQILQIEQPEVALDKPGVYLPGDRPRLAFTARNAGAAVAFTARRFDLVRYAEEPAAKQAAPRLFRGFDSAMFHSKDEGWKKHVSKRPVAEWTEPLPSGQDGRVVEGATLAPLMEPGAYMVEARVAGTREAARALVVVTDQMLLRKTMEESRNSFPVLIVAYDARTGRPLPNRAVRVYESWSIRDSRKGTDGSTQFEQRTFITDADGAIVYRRGHAGERSSIEALMLGENGRLAFSAFEHAIDYTPGPDDKPAPEETWKVFVVTDRPVYRPGATVHLCLWLRRKRLEGGYRVPPPTPVQVKLRGPATLRGDVLTLQPDASGVASVDWTIPAGAPLGEYWVVSADEDDQSWEISPGSFRVEEYRQPEFEVNVRPSTAQARLGGKFKATVEARYYFGAPVTRARAAYKVYRDVFEPAYFEPGEYDWLYGKGYGLELYAYPWLSWWADWGDRIGWGGGHPSLPPGDYYGSPRANAHELVAQGEADLDASGRCEVEVDTARAAAEPGGHDQSYTIEATVRGESRRAVEAKGSVVATRREFYAYVGTDHGWYAPRDEARVQIRTLTPGNAPVAVRGEIVVSRVRYGGANRDEPAEDEEKRWNAETGPDGRLSFTYPLPGEGQYHVSFRTHDSWSQEVQGNAVFWVRGPKFDGRADRFNALEIVSDKRSYRVGETAHLLVNTVADDARLLFADCVADGFALQRYRFLDVPGRSVVVDVPIDESCVPSRFVEATVVRDGRVYTESCELIVPPEHSQLNVTVRTDKPVYRPGEKGTVHVEATDRAGNPAQGEVALTAFDKAVTYIQPESDQTPLDFFHGQRGQYGVEVDSSFQQDFDTSKEEIAGAQTLTLSGGEPEGWKGGWKIGAGALATPLWEVIRDLDKSEEDDDRVVVTGSNIPSAAEAGAPRFKSGGDGALAASAATTVSPTAAAAGITGEPPRRQRPGGGDPAARLTEPEIRSRFADTALWLSALKLDDKGTADAEITFPQSLTTWRVHGYAINAQTQVGDGTAQAVTTRKLLVRLLSPRFFTERDEAVLSAVVNNYLPGAQDVTAELILPAAQFQRTGEGSGTTSAPDAEGNLHLTAQANVAPDGEHRFDWPVKVLRSGLATITARALTAQESDAARLAFPVEVHGVEKTLVQSGSIRAGQDGDRTLRVELPAEIDPEQTQLEVTLVPSLAGVMIDALPYLADYPYGCVEQTLSRFYPSVLVRDVLKRTGTDLETLGKQRRQINPAELGKRFGESPVYDSARLEQMIHDGLASLYDSQRGDFGWSWWKGDDTSSPFQTAYVLQGLQAAKAAGVSVDPGVYDDGFRYLRDYVEAELAKPRGKQNIGDVQEQAYLAYILSLEAADAEQADADRKWLDRLYSKRGELNNYGRALLALALHHANRDEQARLVLRNLLQFVERDDSNETAWVRTPQEGWWFWWNNDIETNAWALKALVALDPKNDLAPRLVKWLVNNRRGGTYWRGTRDTAQVISALADYLLASGEGAPDSTLSVAIDGQPGGDIHVTRENMFTFDNRVRRQGLQLKPGPHEVTIRKRGAGALYYSCRLTYFTREEGVKSAGDEITLERSYFKLVPKGAVPPPAGGAGALRAGFAKVPLKDGDEVSSGEQIEVALKIVAKNTYDYLAFEDRKPAGCEPVEVRSGSRWADGFCSNVELRDTKTVFFVELLEQGEHWLRYRLRAETPGKFHALPATGAAVYAPEVRANSDEMQLKVGE